MTNGDEVLTGFINDDREANSDGLSAKTRGLLETEITNVVSATEEVKLALDYIQSSTA